MKDFIRNKLTRNRMRLTEWKFLPSQVESIIQIVAEMEQYATGIHTAPRYIETDEFDENYCKKVLVKDISNIDEMYEGELNKLVSEFAYHLLRNIRSLDKIMIDNYLILERCCDDPLTEIETLKNQYEDFYITLMIEELETSILNLDLNLKIDGRRDYKYDYLLALEKLSQGENALYFNFDADERNVNKHPCEGNIRILNFIYNYYLPYIVLTIDFCDNLLDSEVIKPTEEEIQAGDIYVDESDTVRKISIVEMNYLLECSKGKVRVLKSQKKAVEENEKMKSESCKRIEQRKNKFRKEK